MFLIHFCVSLQKVKIMFNSPKIRGKKLIKSFKRWKIKNTHTFM